MKLARPAFTLFPTTVAAALAAGVIGALAYRDRDRTSPRFADTGTADDR